MGVSVRLSRNSRVYLPFWIAIPFGLLYFTIVASVYLLVWTFMGLWWLCVFAGRGISALRHRHGGPPTSSDA